LRREGVRVHHKRVYRLYREEQLIVRCRHRPRYRGQRGQSLPLAVRPNERWSMDFMMDTFADGRKLRLLTIVDDATRECLAIEVETSLPGMRVVRVLERRTRGKPKRGRPIKTGPSNRQRWTVERCFGWMDNCRGLVVRNE
jgi:putative transposase